MTSFDVAVVGGGPAGLAVAAQLQRRGGHVVVLERGSYDDARVGESLGADVGPVLRALGAFDAMADVLGEQLPRLAVSSAWGSDELVERSAMLHPLGAGWHVDRARFDRELARWAAASGVAIRCDVGACSIAREGDRVRVVPKRGDAVVARLVVDASGRGAPAGGSLGERRWLACDRQIATIARLPACVTSPELLVEAARDGWWYSAPQPDGSLVVVHVSDADLADAGGTRVTRFARALSRTTHTAARVGDNAVSSVRVVRAGSGRALPDAGRGWCTAGDAAMARDPLAGDGVTHALRDAVELGDTLARALDTGEPAVRADVDRSFADYLDRRDAYYSLETRWPDAVFWRRRRAGAWRDEPVTLHPEAVLVRAASPDRAVVAPVEALLPPRAIGAVLAALETPRPAHELMTTLREHAPLGDRRLLAGLQRLVELNAIARH